MRSLRCILLVVSLLLVVGCRQDVQETFEFATEPLTVEGRQSSMMGPQAERWLHLTEEPELIWITGYEIEVLDSKSLKKESAEFLCHASLDVMPSRYDVGLRPPFEPNPRLFTLSQGLTEVHFPKGFAVPFLTRDAVRLQAQVLNLNEKSNRKVSFRGKIHFIRDSRLTEPMKALFLVRAPVLKAVDPKGSSFGPALGESACSAGINANPEGYLEEDSEGELFIPHWKLSQGREENKTLITERLDLSKEMTVHYMACHVHPTAKSLELIDLTNMESLFRADFQQEESELKILELPHYSSQKGLRLSPEHEYGLLNVYENRSGQKLDAMAVLYLYLHDPAYRPPRGLELSTPLPPRAVVVKRDGRRRTFSVAMDFKLVEAFYEDALDDTWTGSTAEGSAKVWTRGEFDLRLRRTQARETQISMGPKAEAVEAGD